MPSLLQPAESGAGIVLVTLCQSCSSRGATCSVLPTTVTMNFLSSSTSRRRTVGEDLSCRERRVICSAVQSAMQCGDGDGSASLVPIAAE